MGTIEIRRLREQTRAMTDEQLNIVVEEIPSSILFLELMRRDAEKDTVINQIKNATQILKGDE